MEVVHVLPSGFNRHRGAFMRKLVLAVALLVPVAAYSQTDATGVYRSTYVQVRMGAAIPQHDDLEFFDPGLAFELGIGVQLTPNVSIEAGLGRFSITAEESAFIPELGATVTVKDTASAIPLTGSLKLGLPLAEKGLVYGLAGAGLYFVSDDTKFSAPGYQTESVDDTATAFGFHFGGGLTVNVAPQWSLGAELRYVISKVELYDVTNNIDSLIVTGGVGYRF